MAAGAPWSERETQSARDAAEEKVLLGLRTVEGVDRATFAALDLDPDDLVTGGFLAVDGDRIAATPKGRPVLDGVLKALLV